MCIEDRLLKELLQESVNKCYREESEEDDLSLIKRGMEQASAARIFYHMQTLINSDMRYTSLQGYKLDCEYYKNNNESKRTPRFHNGTKPDLLLHKRDTSIGNLMIVEFKSFKNSGRKYPETNQCMDEIKLEDFTAQDGYNYQLGVWVKLKKTGPEFIFFKNGSQVL